MAVVSDCDTEGYSQALWNLWDSSDFCPPLLPIVDLVQGSRALQLEVENFGALPTMYVYDST